MKVSIIDRFIPERLYNVKGGRPMVPKGIVIHNTAGSASASDEYNYAYVGAGRDKNPGWHYCVDESVIMHAVPDNRQCWHAGDGGNGWWNNNAIGIEIARSKDYNSDRFYKAFDNAVELTKMLMDKYNIPVSMVKRHCDVSRTACPHRINEEDLWGTFLKRIDERTPAKEDLIFNANNENKEIRKVSDVISVYSKKPKVIYKTFNENGSIWHTAFVENNEDTIVALDYNGKPDYVSNLGNEWFANNGYERVLSVNAGYFIMKTGEPVGAVVKNWEGKWSTFGKNSLQPTKGKGFPTIYTTAENGKAARLQYLDGWANEFKLSSIYWARSVGQSLVINGEVDGSIGKENPRSATAICASMIGQTAAGDWVFAANTVKGMTHEDRAKVMKRLGCEVAFDLDGGGSTHFEIMKKYAAAEPVKEAKQPEKQSYIFRVRKSWTDASSQIGAYTSLENAKAACKDGYYVYDENGKVLYPEPKAPKEPEKLPHIYRIRKTWEDEASQLGAFIDFNTAKSNLKPGYTIFDETGKALAAMEAPAAQPQEPEVNPKLAELEKANAELQKGISLRDKTIEELRKQNEQLSKDKEKILENHQALKLGVQGLINKY